MSKQCTARAKKIQITSYEIYLFLQIDNHFKKRKTNIPYANRTISANKKNGQNFHFLLQYSQINDLSTLCLIDMKQTEQSKNQNIQQNEVKF